MPSAFELIGNSFRFWRKQPVLTTVTIVLIWLPLLLQSLLTRGLEPMMKTQKLNAIIVSLLALLLVIALMAWGSACVLVIGKRMLGSAAGRSRTSFRAVRAQATGFVIPLLLTDILRTINTFLWSLLLLVPGIIYGTRTIFAPVIVVAEGISYRPALKRSKESVHGRTGRIFWRLLTFLLVLALPAGAFGAIVSMLDPANLLTFLGLQLLSTCFTAAMTTMFNLSLIALYGELRVMVDREIKL